jgi:hypothetical protein
MRSDMAGRKSITQDLDKLAVYAHDNPLGHEPSISNGGTRKTKRMPNEEEIRMRAYQIFLSRNGNGGSPEEDWLQAEEELRGKPTAKRTTRARSSSAKKIANN